jgi:hypothetical protein
MRYVIEAEIAGRRPLVHGRQFKITP